MDRTTQLKMTLAALKQAGDKGLPATWFYNNQIMRGAARINDLKNLNYIIDGRWLQQEPGKPREYRYFLKPNEQLVMEIE